jgi:hypothetical protein
VDEEGVPGEVKSLRRMYLVEVRWMRRVYLVEVR